MPARTPDVMILLAAIAACSLMLGRPAPPLAQQTPEDVPGGLPVLSLDAEIVSRMEAYLDTIHSPPMPDYPYPKPDVLAPAVRARKAWLAVAGDYVAVLAPHLEDSRPQVRGNVALLLGGARSAEAVAALLEREESEDDPTVKMALDAALAECGDRPEERSRRLLEIYQAAGPDGDGWTPALMLVSIHHQKAIANVDKLSADGGLAPLIHGAVELRKACIGK